MSAKRAKAGEGLPIRMLHDRVLVSLESEGERKSGGGILIPATAAVGKRLSWAEVVATGPAVRQVEVGDGVLFDAVDRHVFDLLSMEYVVLGERYIKAIGARRVDDDGATGLYL